MKISMTGQEKRWPFNTGDCLIEVITLAGLTVYDNHTITGCVSKILT